MPEFHSKITLTREEVEEILEPIQDHGHCWSFIAAGLIRSEKIRRLTQKQNLNLRLGPYGDWPADGH